ncbi:MAG: hypothetical protein LBV73_24955 [Paraburkholderia sp.]|jgi:hypothetical protein|nr:hypothetical protein [Paraburkholderia sp.]
MPKLNSTPYACQELYAEQSALLFDIYRIHTGIPPKNREQSLAQNLSGGEKKTSLAEFSDKLLHHKKQGGSLPQAPPAVWPTADGEC